MSEARPGCSTSQQDGNHSKRAALPPVYGNMFYGNMTAEINLSEVGGITIRNSTQGGANISVRKHQLKSRAFASSAEEKI